jgi:hypothetical protein
MCISSGSTVNIEIHMPIIESIELNGSGNMDIDDFDCNSLEISNSGSGNIDISNIYSTTTIDIEVDGSGDVKISGKARRGTYDVNGSGSIYAEDLLLTIVMRIIQVPGIFTVLPICSLMPLLMVQAT